MDFRGQASVVQKVESVILRINLYPMDTGVENGMFLSEMGPWFGVLGTHPHQEFLWVPPPPTHPPAAPMTLKDLFY